MKDFLCKYTEGMGGRKSMASVLKKLFHWGHEKPLHEANEGLGFIQQLNEKDVTISSKS